MVTPPVSAAASRLGEALGGEIGKIRQFVDLLKREQALLQQGEADALLPVIDNKNQIASELGNYAAEREHELARLGLSGGRIGMEAWLNTYGKPAYQQDWQALLTLAAEARELNVVNGKLIGLHMSHNQQAFSALMSASNRAMTYGPDGQQQGGIGSGGRILGTA